MFDMRILIAVPTKGRVDTIGKNTLAWLSRVRGYDWKLFVEPQEMGLYRKLHPKLQDHLVDIGENDKGLMFSLRFIQQYAWFNKYDAIFKIDDDVAGWYGRERKKSPFSAKTFEDALQTCSSTMEADMRIGGISFSYSHQMFEEKEEWSVKGRMQSCYLVHTNLLYVPEGLQELDDFGTFINIRANGLLCPRYNWLGMDIKPVAKYPGGPQLFDRKKGMEVSREILARDFPFLKFKAVEGKPWAKEPDMRSVP